MNVKLGRIRRKTSCIVPPNTVEDHSAVNQGAKGYVPK